MSRVLNADLPFLPRRQLILVLWRRGGTLSLAGPVVALLTWDHAPFYFRLLLLVAPRRLFHVVVCSWCFSPLVLHVLLYPYDLPALFLGLLVILRRRLVASTKDGLTTATGSMIVDEQQMPIETGYMSWSWPPARMPVLPR